MKRKIALLLAVGTILSMCPINTFAASTNTLTKTPTAVSDKAAFVEQGVLGTSTVGGLGVPLGVSVLEIAGNNDIKEVVEAPYLEIEPKSTIAKGSTFKLRLENAKWFVPGVTSGAWGGMVTGSALRLAEDLMGTLIADQKTLGNALNEFGLETTYRTDLEEVDMTGRVYTRYRDTIDAGAAPADTDILYRLTISSGDERDATVTFPNEMKYTSSGLFKTAGGSEEFLDPEADSGKFWIPLMVRSTGTGEDVTVSIVDNNLTSVSSGTWVFGATNTAMTRTYVGDPQTSRDEFPIDMLVIQELRVGSMENGSVEISAPAGYSFPMDFLANAEVVTENFTYGSDVSYTLTPTSEYTLNFRPIRGESDYSTLVLTFKDLSFHKSNRVAGTVFIRDGAFAAGTSEFNTFRLYAEENAGWGDINMRIRNTSGSDIVTNESFLAGVRKDWTMNFFTTTEIPTLVSGRYQEDDSVLAQDDIHMAATVAFNENTVNAWWSGRSTNFTLPEGVKVRKMEITKAKNIDQETNLKDPGTNDGFYMNTGKKQGYVTINDNNINITNLQIKQGKKAELEMDLWLSVASGYEGDITLTAGGSAITDELESIIIAKAINPVTVRSTVSDVRIGYQYYPVADIEIVENAPGMLERGKQVWLTVTDRIHMDMFFTPGFSHEVTEGNIRIKNVDIATGNRIEVTSNKITNTGGLNLGSGTITFDVDSTSSTASTIKFSNLQLKVDRTVPESSQSAYSVYVWGPNVAPNADVFDYSGVTPPIPSSYLGRDQHSSIGISTPYVRVVTSANDKNNILSSVVKVMAGSATANVNGEDMAIDPAPFIDNFSRMQVPVRALANLLGVREEQIIWSDRDRTVTINMVNRTVQFTIGSDIMLVNGAPVRMDTEAMIIKERTFIPFRYLGDALGVAVTYDEANKTAIFNESIY